MTTQEGNKLIGKFMGHSRSNWSKEYGHFEDDGFHAYHYDHDWSALMPVVEKIESLYDDFHGHFGVSIYSNSCTIQGTKLRTDPENFHPAYLSDPNAIFHTKIESTWYNVVSFIQWYNSQSKPTGNE